MIVGEVTHRLTRGAIEYVELEPLELKGKAEPVPGLGGGPRRGPRAAHRAAPRRATPLVGREDESELLLSLFERVVGEWRPTW